MTPMQMALFTYLARHAGHVCTRAILLREVWGWEDASQAQTRTVDVTVCGLRMATTNQAIAAGPLLTSKSRTRGTKSGIIPTPS